jgi:hypothetical protein
MDQDYYKILCYVESVDSAGFVTIHGADGCFVEYVLGSEKPVGCNIFWKLGADKILGAEKPIKVEDPASTMFMLLLQAKGNAMKAEVKVDFGVDGVACVKSVKLI